MSTAVNRITKLDNAHTQQESSHSALGPETLPSDSPQKVLQRDEKAYGLPQNWPKIPQLKHRQWSIELYSCKTPSVKRAVSHIELFQNVIDDWFVKLSEQLKSEKVSQYRSAHDDLDKAATNLHSQEIPYLGAQEVIEEVITLLAELETDRTETQERYIREAATADWLQRKIDELQLRHLQMLPTLVQREHESCIVDLHEMNWHVSYTKRIQAKAQNRFSASKRLNTQLKEDMDFVKQHVPLVQEKLVLEIEAMDKIRRAQGEADQELVVTQQREAKTEMRYKEAMSKAATEKSHIKKELERAREDLRNINELLTEAKMTYSSYVHQISDIQKHLDDNGREIEVVRVKNDNARIAEELQATKVRNLQTRLTEAEFDQRHLESENQKLETEMNEKKTLHGHQIIDLEHQDRAAERQLRMLKHKTLELSIEVKDNEEKIAKCDQQKAAHEKSVTRINQETEKMTELFCHISEQHVQISSTNQSLHDQLLSLKDQIFHTEEKMKTAAMSLQRQVQEEIQIKTILEAKINSDLVETDTTKAEMDKKKEKALGVTQEVEAAVSSVQEKVNKLKNIKTGMLQQKEDISSKISETKKQHEESQERFTQILEQTQPQHRAVKDQLHTLIGQLRAIEEHIKMMNSKIEEMDAAQKMMARSVAKSEQVIQLLESENDEFNLQVTASKKMEGDLRRQYNDILERLRNNDYKHKDLLGERQKVLTTHKDENSRLTERNKKLAARYRQLQLDYIIRREQMLRSYEERVKTEAAITDIKQLKSIQIKLHVALMEYFKLSGLYSEAKLSKLEQESSLNGTRVSELQLSMEQALDQISRFLSSEMGGKLVKQKAAMEVPVLPPIKPLHSSSSRPDLGQEAVV